MRLWEFYRSVSALAYPNRCPFCDRLIGIREFWCENCYNVLKFITEPENVPENMDGFSAVCRYTGRARSAVIRMKRGYYRYSIDAFAVLIAENAQELVFGADIITSIPTGRKRKIELGYAQSEEIAKMIARITRKPFGRTLEVTKEKKEQKRLNFKERQENAQKAYRLIHPKRVAGKSVLLIDDISTTGATLSAAAGILKNAGAKSVMGAVFAKTARV